MDFKLMKISFCDRMADNIVTTENKKFILDILKDKYDINIQKKYALILNEKNIKFVQMNPHLITVKTAGSNYYLFLTKVNDEIMYIPTSCDLTGEYQKYRENTPALIPRLNKKAFE